MRRDLGSSARLVREFVRAPHTYTHVDTHSHRRTMQPWLWSPRVFVWQRQNRDDDDARALASAVPQRDSRTRTHPDAERKTKTARAEAHRKLAPRSAQTFITRTHTCTHTHRLCWLAFVCVQVRSRRAQAQARALRGWVCVWPMGAGGVFGWCSLLGLAFMFVYWLCCCVCYMMYTCTCVTLRRACICLYVAHSAPHATLNEPRGDCLLAILVRGNLAEYSYESLKISHSNILLFSAMLVRSINKNKCQKT